MTVIKNFNSCYDVTVNNKAVNNVRGGEGGVHCWFYLFYLCHPQFAGVPPLQTTLSWRHPLLRHGPLPPPLMWLPLNNQSLNGSLGAP